MYAVSFQAFRGVPDPEVRQLVIHLQPELAVLVIMRDDLVGKERQARIANPCKKAHQCTVREKIPPAVDAQHIQKQEKRCDQKRYIGIGPDVDQDIEGFQEYDRRPGKALYIFPALPFFPCGRSRIRIGIGSAEDQVEKINGREGYKPESHVVTHPVSVDQRRSPDQADCVKKQNAQITGKTCPEHDLADPFKGDVLYRHHHDKQL